MFINVNHCSQSHCFCALDSLYTFSPSLTLLFYTLACCLFLCLSLILTFSFSLVYLACLFLSFLSFSLFCYSVILCPPPLSRPFFYSFLSLSIFYSGPFTPLSLPSFSLCALLFCSLFFFFPHTFPPSVILALIFSPPLSLSLSVPVR